MKTFLFMGDSITDAGRERTEGSQNLGHGYATMAAGLLCKKYPGKLRFENRGISGNRIVDLYARIKCDAINVKPDYMSILIGINDVWHEFGSENGVSAEKYEKIYSMYIEELKEALPEMEIFILEPFVTGDAVLNEFGEAFRQEVEKRAQAARRIAEKYGLTFVSLQEKFTALADSFGGEYATGEGVHPTIAGHSLIAEELAEAFATRGFEL